MAEEKVTISEAVKASLSNLGDRTRSVVVEHYAQKEADRQAAALIKGLDKLGEAEKTLSRMKPDLVAYDGEGAVTSESWSKEKIEEKKKLSDQIEKLRKAIDKADDAGDFGELYNLTK